MAILGCCEGGVNAEPALLRLSKLKVWFPFSTGYILLAVLIAVTRLDRARGTFSFIHTAPRIERRRRVPNIIRPGRPAGGGNRSSGAFPERGLTRGRRPYTPSVCPHCRGHLRSHSSV